MTVELKVRCTRKSRCREGFYLIINGERLRFKSRSAALSNMLDWLKVQRVQVVTVREFAERNARRIKARMPESKCFGHELPKAKP
jgi:hypothetical protein